MAALILHHYGTSPFSEKVRIAFGIKRLAWVRDGKHLRGIVSALMVEKKKRLKKAWDALQAKLAERGLGLPREPKPAAAG